MKKIIIFAGLMVMTMTAFCQLFQKKIQHKPKPVILCVYASPTTTEMGFKDFIADEQHIVLARKADGIAVLLIVNAKEFETIKKFASSDTVKNNTPGHYTGLMFSGEYFEDFSWLKRKQIRKNNEASQQLLAQTFNNYEKYVLLEKFPGTIQGKLVVISGESRIIMLKPSELLPDNGEIEMPVVRN